MMEIHVQPSALDGSMRPPGSKSHTIRGVLLSLLASGQSRLIDPLECGDAISALNAARAFGATVSIEDGVWTIAGPDKPLLAPTTIIDTDNSGTTTTLYCSVAALAQGHTIITGDEQIRSRPIAPLIRALNELGATAFFTHPSRKTPPVIIQGTLKGGRVTIEGRNSQFVSSLLLSAPLAEGRTEISVTNALETPYVQMTIDWMERYGVSVQRNADYTHFVVEGGQQYTASTSRVPGDWSSAAFPLVGAAITGSGLLLQGLDMTDSQGDKRIIEYLRKFGCSITFQEEGVYIAEGSQLKSDLTIDLGNTPDMLPALAVLATQAEGTTQFVNIEHIRQKETDRIEEMHQKLTSLGCDLIVGDDELVVRGKTPIRGGRVHSAGDHRIAMALVVAGLAAQDTLIVEGGECIAVSYAGFCEQLQACGARIKIKSTPS